MDDRGAVYAVDVWHKPAEAAATAMEGTDAVTAEALASYPLAETFALHSKPGSTRTIFLDLDGGTVSSHSRWGDVAGWRYSGWTVDGTASFSEAEKRIVQEVCARVAEDFAPFDIDLTTEQPPAGAPYRSSVADATYGSRVAFTNHTAIQSSVCGGGCGGVAQGRSVSAGRPQLAMAVPRSRPTASWPTASTHGVGSSPGPG